MAACSAAPNMGCHADGAVRRAVVHLSAVAAGAVTGLLTFAVTSTGTTVLLGRAPVPPARLRQHIGLALSGGSLSRGAGYAEPSTHHLSIATTAAPSTTAVSSAASADYVWAEDVTPERAVSSQTSSRRSALIWTLELQVRRVLMGVAAAVTIVLLFVARLARSCSQCNARDTSSTSSTQSRLTLLPLMGAVGFKGMV